MAFTNDVLLLGRGDCGSIKMMLDAFDHFVKSIGLTVNPKKCKVFFSWVDANTRDMIISMTTFEQGTLPFRFLGVPPSRKQLNVHHYMSLVDNVVGNVRHWRSNLLGHAGRIQLIKSVSFVVANKWIATPRLPKAVIHKIDTILHSFLWTGNLESSWKIHIAWK